MFTKRWNAIILLVVELIKFKYRSMKISLKINISNQITIHHKYFSKLRDALFTKTWKFNTLIL